MFSLLIVISSGHRLLSVLFFLLLLLLLCRALSSMLEISSRKNVGAAKSECIVMENRLLYATQVMRGVKRF